jgi:hypothetical protein
MGHLHATSSTRGKLYNNQRVHSFDPTVADLVSAALGFVANLCVAVVMLCGGGGSFACFDDISVSSYEGSGQINLAGSLKNSILLGSRKTKKRTDQDGSVSELAGQQKDMMGCHSRHTRWTDSQPQSSSPWRTKMGREWLDETFKASLNHVGAEHIIRMSFLAAGNLDLNMLSPSVDP